MTILEKDRDALIEYRLKQAFEASEAAKTLISLKHSADYDSFVVFENVDIELLFNEMISFISRIERFIKE